MKFTLCNSTKPRKYQILHFCVPQKNDERGGATNSFNGCWKKGLYVSLLFNKPFKVQAPKDADKKDDEYATWTYTRYIQITVF